MAVQPTVAIPCSRASTTPKGVSSSMTVFIMRLYRGSKMCSGKVIPGKSTTARGKSGMCSVVMRDIEIVTLCGHTCAASAEPKSRSRGGQLREGRFHLRPGVLIAGPASRLDTGAKGALGVGRSREARQELSILEITRDVIGIFGEQLFKVGDGRGGIALVGAFHGQAVARERVLWMRGKEFLEHGTASFLLWLRHSVIWARARKRVLYPVLPLSPNF